MEIFGLITSLLFLASIIILVLKATKEKAKPKLEPFKKTNKVSSSLTSKVKNFDTERIEKSSLDKEITETVIVEKSEGELAGEKSILYKILLKSKYTPENSEENLETVFGVKRIDTLQTFRSSYLVLDNGEKFEDSNDSIEFFRAELIKNMLVNDEVSLAIESLKGTKVDYPEDPTEVIKEYKQEVLSENYRTSILLQRKEKMNDNNKVTLYEITVSETQNTDEKVANVMNVKTKTKKAKATLIAYSNGDVIYKNNETIDYYYAQIIESLLKENRTSQAIEIFLSVSSQDIL